MHRRELLAGSAALAALTAFAPLGAMADTPPDFVAALSALEHTHGGRLGVAVLDTGNGRYLAHRGDERFLMCSTFKLALAAAVLVRVDRGEEQLARRVVFDERAVLDWAPVTALHVGAPGMTVEQLCEAVVIISDNTAANLLLETLGGPSGFTAILHDLGDESTRLDHWEPLNNRPSGEQDTTTPRAMLETMRRCLLGDVLSVASRDRLIRWLTLNQTGAHGIEAGLPARWHIGDKTGSADIANNDIAIIWPPERAPLLVTAYYMTREHDRARRKRVLMSVGSLVASSL